MPVGEHVVRIDGHRLRLTNLEKVLYPATGTTKGEVIDYYSRIAPLMLPHLTSRPVTRKRWPEGTEAEPFFAKDLESGAPSWLPRISVEHSSGAKAYPLVSDLADLVYLAQAASLELHVPQWRFDPAGSRGTPDRLVLDLDPGPGAGLAECAQVARWAREILQGMGLDPLPVTSGSKGIHLYAALPGHRSSDEVAAVARELARALEADHPELVVSQMAKSQREGKVFVDWSQNNAAKTTIAPYSLRGRERPTVAAPRTWDELEAEGLTHLELADVLERAGRIGDPLAALSPAAAHPLHVYLSKRSAERTPEPMPTATPAPAARDEPRFVIQEHHASRLHWDLRLEHGGVLVSWAVPRGIPPSPQRNNLAIMTEDHPLEYLDFAGEIPRGQYGAGTMTVWDAGTYALEKWRDDEIIATLHGREAGPLGHARIALIRTQGQGEKSSWLLHRMKADATGAPQPDQSTAARPAPPQSAPGRGDTDASFPATATPDVGSTHPMLATASTPGLARAAAGRWATSGAAPWVEIKWDGVRAIGIWDGDALRLRARSGSDITATYPELTETDLGLGSTPAVVDGEIVALDARGHPSFPLLQKRMNLSRPEEIRREAPRTPVRFHLFDVLWVDGRDTASLPLASRRELLEALAADARLPLAVPPVLHDVDDALATSARFALEGIVVKDPGSPYRRGERSERWLKVKLTQTQDVVIGGIRPGRGGRAGAIGSLLVGVPGPGGLRYAGRVGSGFSDASLRELARVLEPLRTDDPPFVEVPKADASDALWVRAERVGEVEFAEFTPGGILRQARWRGLRPDKRVDEVMREDFPRDDDADVDHPPF